jgi:hypothetical protein
MPMKLKTVLGLALIALGLIAFVYATRSRVIDMGPVHMTTERSHHFPLSPIVGGVAIAGGIVVLLVGKSTTPRLASSR